MIILIVVKRVQTCEYNGIMDESWFLIKLATITKIIIYKWIINIENIELSRNQQAGKKSIYSRSNNRYP